MSIEIERKFLVQGEFRKHASRMIEITQWYLVVNSEQTVRIRMQDDKNFFLTEKGITNASGLSRSEDEHEITREEAEELLKSCDSRMIIKTRYLVPIGNHTWEVDIFHGENEGLVIAEIELLFEDESFIKSAWVGMEVTGEIKYYNSSLVKFPYKQWDSISII